MASVRKQTTATGKITFQAIWREGHGANRPQRTKNFETHKEAKDHARHMEEQFESRQIGGAQKQNVYQFLDEWIGKLQRKPTTIAGYRRNIGILKRELPDMALTRLSAKHLDDAYGLLLERGGRDAQQPDAKLPLTKQTVLHIHRTVHAALAQAVDWELLSLNPASRAKPPSVPKGKKAKGKVRAFTIAEAAAQIEIAINDKRNPETFLMICTLWAAGLRRSEMLGLSFDDGSLNLDAGTIDVRRTVTQVDEDGEGSEVVVNEVPKTEDSERTIMLPPSLVAMLRVHHKRVLETALKWGPGYQRKPLYAFPGPGGGPMEPRLVTNRLRRLMARAGIAQPETKKISPAHSWRHLHGTSLWHAFKDVKQVQERMGHATSAITMDVYVHNEADADRRAADFFEALLTQQISGRL